MPTPTHILIAHQSPLVAAGIAFALSWEGDARTAAFSGAAAYQAESASEPAVLIGDHLTVVAWLTQARQAAQPQPRCLVVGDVLRGWLVRRALEQGVYGYIDAQCALPEIANAVRAVSQGQRYLCAAASACIADCLAQESLTPREMQVLGLISEGLGNKSIASQLDIALGTVKAHVRTVLDKLGAASRTQAVAAARRRGLLADLALPG